MRSLAYITKKKKKKVKRKHQKSLFKRDMLPQDFGNVEQCINKVDSVYYIRVKVLGLPSGGNQIMKAGWRELSNQTKKWKRAVLIAVGSTYLPPKPLKRVKMRFTRASSNTMDWDNLVISFKAVQDALTEAGIIQDDKITNIPTMPEYRQIKAPRGAGYIVIEVKEL